MANAIPKTIDRETRFSEIITTEGQLREVTGHPTHRIRTKAVGVLEGDPAGFVRVLDESTLAIPDRPGNRRADTFRNLLQRSHVGLLFLIPGRPDTLRVNGIAMIVRDEWLRDQMAVGGKAPDLALVVTVEEVFLHCPKCMVRSKLWDPAQWPDLAGLASFARVTVERGRLDVSVEDTERLVAKNTREHLY